MKSLDKPQIAPELLQTLYRQEHHSYTRLLVFLGLYSTSAIAVFHLSQVLPSFWIYLVGIPFYLIAAASLHGISLFTHEGVHGVLDRNPHINRFLSIACALPVGQNFSAYQVLHLKHHQHLGDEGDPDRYKNYTRQPGLVFLMYWGRLIIGYPVYLVAIPILGWLQGNAKERFWIVLEVLLLGLGVIGAILSPIPSAFWVHGWLIPMLLINVMVNIRGMSQHTLLEPETDIIRGTRTILTSPLVRFFMCNENYHLEHHLYPAVPWYHLPQLHAELKAELESLGAPYIPSYFSFVRDFAIASLTQTTTGSVAILPKA
ncbi:MAG: fatty acid desaturase [Desertifilum sp.]|nr:fatty acid desaturase [Desertifilum sp.]MDI9634272.1 fatty acid desaturase [Geitlerinema splendidum]